MNDIVVVRWRGEIPFFYNAIAWAKIYYGKSITWLQFASYDLLKRSSKWLFICRVISDLIWFHFRLVDEPFFMWYHKNNWFMKVSVVLK